MSHHQHDGADLPLVMLIEEAMLISEFVDRQTATEAVLIQMAISTVLGGRQAHQEFNKVIKRMTGDG